MDGDMDAGADDDGDDEGLAAILSRAALFLS